jgi:hypothetical protein
MHFDNDELEHGKRCLEEGFTVICHPWPTDAQIPWPAVVRNGVQQGTEVALVKPFLLKPMTALEIEEMKARNSTWLEEVCVPWGWTCLSPMWTTHLNADYLANRRHQVSREGFIKSLPRLGSSWSGQSIVALDPTESTSAVFVEVARRRSFARGGVKN